MQRRAPLGKFRANPAPYINEQQNSCPKELLLFESSSMCFHEFRMAPQTSYSAAPDGWVVSAIYKHVEDLCMQEFIDRVLAPCRIACTDLGL